MHTTDVCRRARVAFGTYVGAVALSVLPSFGNGFVGIEASEYSFRPIRVPVSCAWAKRRRGWRVSIFEPQPS